MDDKNIQELVNKLMMHVLPSVNRVREDELLEVYVERTGHHVYFYVSRDYDVGYVFELDVPSDGNCVLEIARNSATISHHAFIFWTNGDSESLKIESHAHHGIDGDDLIGLNDVIDLAYRDIHEVLTKSKS